MGLCRNGKELSAANVPKNKNKKKKNTDLMAVHRVI